MSDKILEAIENLEKKIDDKFKSFRGDMEKKFKELDEKIDTVKKELGTEINNIKVTVNETNQIAKAIEHSNNVGKAEIDSIKIDVAYLKADSKRIKNDVYTNEEMTGQNIKDIANLKKKII